MSDAAAGVVQSAPAKINLALHVTGQRADGYHLLDSLVVFAVDAADQLTLAPSSQMSLSVTGPRAAGVPEDARNLCWKAAEAFGATAAITLEKHLPNAAGIGGGSSDAAAILRGLQEMTGRAFAGDASALGADIPVCLAGRAARMEGIGEIVTPVSLPPLFAVLVNPGVDVPTPAVFKGLARKDNAPMEPLDESDFLAWLSRQRNDLETSALAAAPVISRCLKALADADLARMSGSGATCFGLYPDFALAQAAADRIAGEHPDWWVKASRLV